MSDNRRIQEIYNKIRKVESEYTEVVIKMKGVKETLRSLNLKEKTIRIVEDELKEEFHLKQKFTKIKLRPFYNLKLFINDCINITGVNMTHSNQPFENYYNEFPEEMRKDFTQKDMEELYNHVIYRKFEERIENKVYGKESEKKESSKPSIEKNFNF